MSLLASQKITFKLFDHCINLGLSSLATNPAYYCMYIANEFSMYNINMILQVPQ